MNAAQRQFFNRIFFEKSFSLVKILAINLVLLAAVSTYARTPAEYRTDVKAANLMIQNLLDPDEEIDFDEFAKMERGALKQIRVLLPATERIEWHGITVETDNRWLLENLNKFEQTPESDDKRWDVLTEIGERLAAIEKKLDQLENQSSSSGSKDEAKQKLAEILRREEYQKPAEKQEPSFVEKVQRQIAEWIAKIFPRPNITPSTATDFQPFSFVLQMILYALILGAIAFVIYRFAPFFVKRFRSRESKEKHERVILGERLAADETAQNLFAEAENLARAGDLRGAIRKGYIALLCDLSDRQIIRLSQHKTNRDYLRDVSKKKELFQNMNGLTLNYERHWYGFDEAETADWENFRNSYREIIKN